MIGLSVVFSCVVLVRATHSGILSVRQLVLCVLFAPVANLHLLIVGLLYIQSTNAGLLELAERRHQLITRLKSLETGLEAIPLAIATLGAIIKGVGGDESTGVLVASLVLSTLSMTWGLCGFIIETADPDAPAASHPGSLFFCVLCQVGFALATWSVVFAYDPSNEWLYSEVELCYQACGEVVWCQGQGFMYSCCAGCAFNGTCLKNAWLPEHNGLITDVQCTARDAINYSIFEGPALVLMGASLVLAIGQSLYAWGSAMRKRRQEVAPESGTLPQRVGTMTSHGGSRGLDVLLNLVAIIFVDACVLDQRTYGNQHRIAPRLRRGIFICSGLVFGVLIGDWYAPRFEHESLADDGYEAQGERTLSIIHRKLTMAALVVVATLIENFSSPFLFDGVGVEASCLVCCCPPTSVGCSRCDRHKMGYFENSAASPRAAGTPASSTTSGASAEQQLHSSSTARAPAEPRVPLVEEDVEGRRAALTGGYIELSDMIDGLLMGGATWQPPPDGMAELLECCGHFKEKLPSLPPATRATATAAIKDYLPWVSGSQRRLLATLAHLQADHLAGAAEVIDAHSDDRAVGEGAEQDCEGAFVHPMRAVPMGKMLDVELWRAADFVGQDSETKRQADAANWARSVEVTYCDFFVSHAWADEARHPHQKVRLMRQYLCMQPLVAGLLASGGVVCLYFFPMGVAIHSIEGSIPAALPALLVLGVLALALAWIALASSERLPSFVSARLGEPWRYSPRTLWLDKTCILQESSRTIAAGTSSFARFLGCCDRMLAFVSPAYFTRLWCVYELATFCRDHAAAGELDQRLLLFSLEWSTWRPESQITDEERSWFQGFRCYAVQCAKPADRAFVLGEIRKNWGSEADFDHFVRTSLPRVLANSKARYAQQMSRVMSDAVVMLFGH